MASTAMKIKKCVDTAYQNAFIKALQKLRQNEEYTDVTLQSGDVHIPCHRIVLEAASDYFKAMFRCGLQESTSDTVQLTIEPVILAIIVDYIYTGEIELTVDNVESLVKACDVLQLNCLKDCCGDFMVEQLDVQNCIGFYRFATSYLLDKLQKKAKQLILAEFKTVAFNAEFKELTCDEAVEHITDDDVNVENEDIVFEAVLGWVRHDLDNRMLSLETFLEHVRLPYCTSNCLWQTKDIRDLLTPKCSEYLHEALSFQTDPVNHHGISSCRTVPRTSVRMKSCLLVVGGISVDNLWVVQCHYYKEDTHSWESLKDLPQSVGKLYSVCYFDGSLLLTGGIEPRGCGVVNQCWFYNLVANKWEAIPPLICARYFHRSVLLGDCVYVVGGKGADYKALASVECLNLKRRHWSFVPNMPKAVYAPMAVTHGNDIFVFGGRDAPDNDFCYTHMFSTTRGQWSTLSAMTEVCSRGAAVTLNNFIYVVGGDNRTCLKYDPSTDSWTRLSQPQQIHGNAPAVVWRGSILVTGGMTTGSGGAEEVSSVVEQFDPLTDTWSVWSVAHLEKPLGCHGIFNVDLYGL